MVHCNLSAKQILLRWVFEPLSKASDYFGHRQEKSQALGNQSKKVWDKWILYSREYDAGNCDRNKME